MVGLQERLQTLDKSDDVAIVASERHVVLVADHLDDVDGSDSLCFRTDGVEQGHHLLLVGDGDIEPAQFQRGVNDLRQLLDAEDLVVDIRRVDALVLKLLVEIVSGEGVGQRITYQSVFVHNN